MSHQHRLTSLSLAQSFFQAVRAHILMVVRRMVVLLLHNGALELYEQYIQETCKIIVDGNQAGRHRRAHTDSHRRTGLDQYTPFCAQVNSKSWINIDRRAVLDRVCFCQPDKCSAWHCMAIIACLTVFYFLPQCLTSEVPNHFSVLIQRLYDFSEYFFQRTF